MWRRGERLKRVREVGGQPQADSAGGQGVEGGRGEGRDRGTMRLFTRGRRWERWGRSTLPSPAKRILEDARQWVEGRMYERIEANQTAVEEVLRRLEAEGKVSSPVRWRYIRQALNALP